MIPSWSFAHIIILLKLIIEQLYHLCTCPVSPDPLSLRGLHYQLEHGQAKLIYVITGEIFDVAVNIREGSPTFGQWIGEYLSAENKRQIFIPEGFAHGFCVISEEADVIYKCTDFYAPGDEYGIFWADPEIKIAWPMKEVVLSEKDGRNPWLSSVPEDALPIYRAK